MQVCYADYGTVEWIDTPLRLLRLAVDFLLAIFYRNIPFSGVFCSIGWMLFLMSQMTSLVVEDTYSDIFTN